MKSVKNLLVSCVVLFSVATTSNSAFAFEPGSTECIAPAGVGGGWDMTCRQVGKILQELKLIPGTMQVTNKAGGGGGAAFAEVVNKLNENNNLIVAASSSTSTRLAQNAYPGNDMSQVRWLASVGADYGVIGVAADSEINTLPELMEKVKADPKSVSFAGGSAAGGWDHLKVLLVAKKSGIDDVRKIKYIVFDGGAEAITQLMGGKVNAFTGDASEAMGFVEAGKLKILAVLAPERLEGDFNQFPTAKEQGLEVVGANWRGFYAPGGMSDEAYQYWSESIGKVYNSEAWKEVMQQNGLAPLGLQGKDFQTFVGESVAEITALSKEIGITK